MWAEPYSKGYPVEASPEEVSPEELSPEDLSSEEISPQEASPEEASPEESYDAGFASGFTDGHVQGHYAGEGAPPESSLKQSLSPIEKGLHRIRSPLFILTATAWTTVLLLHQAGTRPVYHCFRYTF